MPTSQEDALHLIANRKQPEPKVQKRGMLGTILVIAGLGVTIFGIIPALRGTNAKKAWQESKAEDVEGEMV